MLHYTYRHREKKDLLDRLMSILLALFVSASYIFARVTYGRYVFLIIAVLAYLVWACRFNGKLKIRIDKYCGCIIAFGLFCILSSLWAIDAGLAVTTGITIIEIFFCIIPFYGYFSEVNDDFSYFDALALAGHVVALYAFVYFGPSGLLKLLFTSTRMPDSFDNSNSIGMICAYAIVIDAMKLMSKKPQLHMLLCVPSMLVVVASGSRKALLLVILGVIIGYSLKCVFDGRGIAVLKLIAGFLVFSIGLYYLLSLPVFSMVMTRIERMLLTLSGQGTIDNSTAVRQEMIQIGLKLFKENPIFGNGMNNSSQFGGAVIEQYNYLHNNYVELLAGGGLIGTLIYYRLYAIPIFTIIRRRKDKQLMDPCVLAILAVLLIMDYGAVTYYSKSTHVIIAAAYVYTNVTNKRIGEKSI